MPFEHGTFSLAIYDMPKPLPEDALARFAARVAGKLDDVKEDEPQVGWVSGRHLLDRRIDEETAVFGGHIHLHLRTAERKMPASLLKAECRMEELLYMESHGVADVPRKVKADIKKTVMERRLPTIVPQINGIPLIHDKMSRSLFVGSSSPKQLDLFVELFDKTIGVTPVPVTPDSLMEKAGLDPRAYEPLQFLDGHQPDDLCPARDFLTWLWFFSECEGGELSVPDRGDFAAMVDGPLTFAAEGEGAHESVVRKGNPLRSAEARAALTVGKKLRKAKIVLARGDDVWSANFDADSFTYGSVSLPEGESMDIHGRFMERTICLNTLKEAVAAYFKRFVADVSGAKREKTLAHMAQWAQERDSL